MPYTAAELKEYLDTGFTQICTWYCENKLTLNVKKTKLMLTGIKNTLSTFENFEFKYDGVVIDRVKSFKYLGVTTDEKWSRETPYKELSQDARTLYRLHTVCSNQADLDVPLSDTRRRWLLGDLGETPCLLHLSVRTVHHYTGRAGLW